MRNATLAGLVLLACAAQAAEPPPSIAIGGLVQHPGTLTLDALRALPPVTVEVATQTSHGIDTHKWTGPLLWTVLAQAGLKDEPGVWTFPRHAILVTGRDGYAATIAIGEIDPSLENKAVVIALAESDHPPLAMPRIMVPGDRHGARDVHELVSITVR